VAAILTIITKADIEAYAKERLKGARNEEMEALVRDDPLARQVFLEAAASQRNTLVQES
jgi:hypothetical protein